LQGVVVATLSRLPATDSYHSTWNLLLLDVLLLTADIAWRQVCQAAPWGGSYARHREVIPALMIVNHTMVGKSRLPAWAWLEQVTVATDAGGAASVLDSLLHLAIIAIASRVLTTSLLWSNPVRVR